MEITTRTRMCNLSHRGNSPNHEGKLRELKYSNPAACLACPLRSRCTTNLRRVSRLENEAVLDRMAARLTRRR